MLSDAECTGYKTKKQNETNFIEKKLEIWLITLLSQPQIAYKLIEAGGAENILQVQGLYIDGLNNSEDTTL